MKSSNVTAGEDIRSHWNIVGNMKQDPEQKQAAIKSVVLLWAFLICCLFQDILRVGFEHSYLLRVFFFKEADSHKEGLEATQVFTSKRGLANRQW